MTMTTKATSTAPVLGCRAELNRLSDDELLVRFRALPRDSHERDVACELLVERYERLVRSCVRQYRGSPEPVEDLMQVGYVGLMKAINNYDPEIGHSLTAYAAPCVTGDDLLEARQADMVFTAYSLDAPLSDREDPALLSDVLGDEDADMEHTIDMEAVSTHWEELPEREQRILVMRFYGNLTQAEIGDRLGISQMHVSRLLARALSHLRSRLLDSPDVLATSA
jgi:RNA polymerase sigma-B factor